MPLLLNISTQTMPNKFQNLKTLLDSRQKFFIKSTLGVVTACWTRNSRVEKPTKSQKSERVIDYRLLGNIPPGKTKDTKDEIENWREGRKAAHQ
jgi:hypothetical protein